LIGAHLLTSLMKSVRSTMPYDAEEICSIDMIERTCFKTGTSCSDSGVTVRIQPTRSEEVQVFHIDDSSNPPCRLRTDLPIIGPICDCVFSYAKTRATSRILCLVELKGSNIEEAVDQILNTYEHVHSRLCREHQQRITFKAYIRLHGASPRDNRNQQERLDRKFRRGNALIRRNPDIGDFLRKA
jgi:hypothetical protein